MGAALVREIERGLSGGCCWRLDERAHGAVAVGFQRQGAFAGTLQLSGAEVLREAQDSLGAAERLLRVQASLRLAAHLCRRRADATLCIVSQQHAELRALAERAGVPAPRITRLP